MIVLKKGGKLIITVPNNENLKSGHVLCPNCLHYFHKMQHVKSFQEKDLDLIFNNLDKVLSKELNINAQTNLLRYIYNIIRPYEKINLLTIYKKK